MQATNLTLPTPPSLPAHLQDLAEQAVEFAEASLSPGTRRKYATAWRLFESWCNQAGLPALSATPETLAMYLTHRTQQGRRVSTIEVDLAAIAAAHESAGFDNPAQARLVRAVLSGVRRRVGVRPTQKAPVTVAQLRKMVAGLPATNRGARDHLVLVLGLASAMRRSELVALRVEDVQDVEDGLRVLIRRSKTDQIGAGRVIGVPYGSHPRTCPVRVLRAWLAVSEISSGALLRSVDRADRIEDRPMSGRAVARCVQRAARSVGLDPASLGGHSLRAGFATAAARGGASERAIAKQTGHRSMQVLRGYIREGELFTDNAAAALGL